MDTHVKFEHDLYRNKNDPSLRVATAPGAKLSAKFKAKDWVQITTGCSPLHSDAPRDIAAQGYCFFQIAKGN